jgi:hypothetical protein
VSVAIELYKHIVSTLHTLELAPKEERCDYVRAWYSMLLLCAQEMQNGGAIWQESCRTNVCGQVISEGINTGSEHSSIILFSNVHYCLRYKVTKLAGFMGFSRPV